MEYTTHILFLYKFKTTEWVEEIEEFPVYRFVVLRFRIYGIICIAFVETNAGYKGSGGQGSPKHTLTPT